MYRSSMSYHRVDEVDYMAEVGEMADFIDEWDDENNGRGGGEVQANEYDLV